MPDPEGLDWAKLRSYKLFQDLSDQEIRAADAAGDGKVPNAGSTMPQGIR